MMSRLWGEWEPQFYPSGTTVVTLRSHQHKPHLYIYADKSINENRNDRDRMLICKELSTYMNGGDRPAWLDDFDRASETGASSLAGGEIFATGPSIDEDPPNLSWRQDDSAQARDDRARLIDALFLDGRKADNDQAN